MLRTITGKKKKQNRNFEMDERELTSKSRYVVVVCFCVDEFVSILLAIKATQFHNINGNPYQLMDLDPPRAQHRTRRHSCPGPSKLSSILCPEWVRVGYDV